MFPFKGWIIEIKVFLSFIENSFLESKVVRGSCVGGDFVVREAVGLLWAVLGENGD
jgi:hypothetical protein